MAASDAVAVNMEADDAVLLAIERIVSGGDDDLDDALQRLSLHSQQMGLLERDILTLVQAICSNSIGLTVCRSIVTSLIPRAAVPEDAVVRALSWACGKSNEVILIRLFRWIVAVFDVVTPKTKLRRLFSVLFTLLKGKLKLCPYIYHLICELLVREEVTMYRVNELMELRKSPETEPYASSLLVIFKRHRPDYVTVKVPTKILQLRKQPTYNWQKFIVHVAPSIDTPFWDLEDQFPALHKNSQFQVDFPNAHGDVEMLVLTNQPNRDTAQVPVRNVDSFDNFLQNIDKLELPPCASTVLRYPLLQHVVSHRKDFATLFRLRLRLQVTLVPELCDHTPSQEDSLATKLMEASKRLTDYLQEGDPTVCFILSNYLKYHWNGVDYAPLIFELLTHAPLHGVCQTLLKPLRNYFICSSVTYQIGVLKAITELLSNSTRTERMLLERVGANVDKYWADERYHEVTESLLNKHRVNMETDDHSAATLNLESIVELFLFANELCEFAMSSSGSNITVCHAVLVFYETVIQLNLSSDMPLVLVAPMSVVRRLLFCSDAISLSRMCQLFVSYQSAMSRIDSLHHMWPQRWTQECLDAIPMLNNVIVEAVDGLWRGKSMQVREHAGSDIISVHTISEALFTQLNLKHPNDSFSIIYHSALFAYWNSFLKKKNLLDEPSKQINQLKSQNRALVTEYIDYLSSCGLTGISNFLATFVKSN